MLRRVSLILWVASVVAMLAVCALCWCGIVAEGSRLFSVAVACWPVGTVAGLVAIMG